MDKKDFKRKADNLLKRFIRAKVFVKNTTYKNQVNILAKLLEDIHSNGYSEGHEEQMRMRILDKRDEAVKSTYG